MYDLFNVFEDDLVAKKSNDCVTAEGKSEK